MTGNREQRVPPLKSTGTPTKTLTRTLLFGWADSATVPFFTFGMRVAASLALLCGAAAQHTRYLLDDNWKFFLLGSAPSPCANPNDFNQSYDGRQCAGLSAAAYANDEAACLAACCAEASCSVYQWCPPGATGCSPAPSCWIGAPSSCGNPVSTSWVSKARTPLPPPPPGPGGQDCTDPNCMPSTDDSSWRTLSVPHDFVVEGTFVRERRGWERAKTTPAKS